MPSTTGKEYNPAHKLSHISGADYSSTDPWVFVKISDADNEVETADSATVWTLGVRINKPESGEMMEVVESGTCLIKVGSGGLTRGDLVTSDSSGQGIATTTTKHVVSGIALQTASENDLCEILLTRFINNV